MDGNTQAGGEGIVEQAQQKVGEVAGQVQDKAGEVVDQVRQQATTRIDQQKDQATASLWNFANAIRDTGNTLRDKDQGAIAQVTDKAAEQVERISAYLAHRDVGQILTEVQHFARRQPGIFVGGAFALGLLGARFLKSSSQPQGSYQDTDYTGQAYRVGSDGMDTYGSASSYSTGSGADAGDWLDRAGESGAGGATGGWSGTDGGYGSSSSGYGGVSGTGSDYSAVGMAPPIRGVDPRVSGEQGGYYSQGYDTAGGTTGGNSPGSDSGSTTGASPYGQDTEA